MSAHEDHAGVASRPTREQCIAAAAEAFLDVLDEMSASSVESHGSCSVSDAHRRNRYGLLFNTMNIGGENARIALVWSQDHGDGAKPYRNEITMP